MMAMLGIGALAGALTLAILGRERPPVAALATPALLQATATGALAAVHSDSLAMPLLLLMGFCGILFMAGANSTVQLTVPDELRGRVMSLYTLIWGGVFPFGAFIVGAISEHWGVGRALLVNGTAGLLGMALLLGWWALRGAQARRRPAET